MSTSSSSKPPRNGRTARNGKSSRDSRKKLLKVALEVFARDGFERATIDSIAQAAGFTKGAVYWHFTDKNNLFTEAVNRSYTELDQILLAEIARKEPLIEKVVTVPVMTLQYYLHHPDFEALWRILVSNGLQDHSGPVREKFQSDYQRYKEMLKEIVLQGMQRREFRPVDAEATASLIGAIPDGLMFYWILSEGHAPPTAVLAIVIEMIHQHLTGKKVEGRDELRKYILPARGK